MADRRELAAFLRTRRARIGPRDAGLPDTGRRRTPGLRRQEVAQLAGVSVEYYIRLEQARGPNPSPQVLKALARALMLDADERAYLFRVAGAPQPETRAPDREVPEGVRHLIAGLTTTPAYVLDARYDVLAWNEMAAHFLGGAPERADGSRHNVIEWMFHGPEDDPRWEDPDVEDFARSSVADLRAAYARYPGDPGITGMVTTLLGVSPRFARMWAARDVRERRGHRKTVHHAEAGRLEFDCQVLLIPDTDQRLITYCPVPGSPTEEALARLRSARPAPVDPLPRRRPVV
ncbi:helix-turn-helix domain-containing protein [Nocardiopsis sp. FIRDI 009]|uniref:helix-turn-helix domain-containing protein n=1 Tax=Nocardiopsis sp. FIRDI 009 TaxID=714197 RepID=UPI000E223742|nr:helix-turn-helix transcriptional regulator [Nocardiopsis sp. FIRDI 009]